MNGVTRMDRGVISWIPLGRETSAASRGMIFASLAAFRASLAGVSIRKLSIANFWSAAKQRSLELSVRDRAREA